MELVKIGIIGIGNMGAKHACSVASGRVENAVLAAVCDRDPARLEWAQGELGNTVERYGDPGQFFACSGVDAVIVATPHYDHPPLAIEAFAHGMHALVEKPAGVYTAQVRELNAAAKESGKVFGIMFNQRTNPLYQKIRQLVQGGELGQIKRINWIITDWYRSQSYYDSGGWRATWAGEGGGVLLNQCPHNLDLWQWMFGMPKRMQAFMAFGKCHDIEVEDDVTAYMEYGSGATGLFITSTHEAPGTNRLEVSCDRGKLVAEDGRLVFHRNRVPERQFNREFKGGFGTPECWPCEIPLKGTTTAHEGILNNWVDAILRGTPLLAPGEEGIKGLALSNAMHLSAFTGEAVPLEELDEDAFYQELQRRIAASDR